MYKKYQSGNSRFFSYCFDQKEINFIVDAYCNKHWGTPKIANIFYVRPSTIAGLLRKHNIVLRNNREKSLKYYCDEHYFDVIDTEHKAYWLGFLYADGYVIAPGNKHSGQIGIALNVKDIEILEKFKNDLKYTGDIKVYTNKTAYGTVTYARIVISSPVLYNSLVNKGVVTQKSLIIKFPSSNVIPQQLIQPFIRGYLDGDGSITHSYKRNNKWNYNIKFCGTKDFLMGIQKNFKTQIKLQQKKDLVGKNNYQLTIGGNKQVYYILKNIYQNATLYLDRKYQIFKQISEKGAEIYE